MFVNCLFDFVGILNKLLIYKVIKITNLFCFHLKYSKRSILIIFTEIFEIFDFILIKKIFNKEKVSFRHKRIRF